MNCQELIRLLTPLHGAGEARAIVRLLMEERFGLSQTDLLLGRDEGLSPSNHRDFEQLADRLLQGAPVQHVLGYEYFCGHRFSVSPSVLIPRPETEELVGHALKLLEGTKYPQNPSSPLHILDLCTGSGCIAISVALAYPEAKVTALDISTEALTVARQNAADMEARNVTFLQHDILQSDGFLKDAVSSPAEETRFHLLLSNPPYVRDSEAAEMSPTVLDHEPHLALFVPDEDPLRFYRAIATIGRQTLVPGGYILLEINASLSRDTLRLFADSGFTDLSILPDQFTRPRFLRGRFQ